MIGIRPGIGPRSEIRLRLRPVIGIRPGIGPRSEIRLRLRPVIGIRPGIGPRSEIRLRPDKATACGRDKSWDRA